MKFKIGIDYTDPKGDEWGARRLIASALRGITQAVEAPQDFDGERPSTDPLARMLAGKGQAVMVGGKHIATISAEEG
jgi:hypothetical protein